VQRRAPRSPPRGSDGGRQPIDGSGAGDRSAAACGQLDGFRR
jgi:hypothetical protein